jgi:hypothetical protein
MPELVEMAGQAAFASAFASTERLDSPFVCQEACLKRVGINRSERAVERRVIINWDEECEEITKEDPRRRRKPKKYLVQTLGASLADLRVTRGGAHRESSNSKQGMHVDQ